MIRNNDPDDIFIPKTRETRSLTLCVSPLRWGEPADCIRYKLSPRKTPPSRHRWRVRDSGTATVQPYTQAIKTTFNVLCWGSNDDDSVHRTYVCLEGRLPFPRITGSKAFTHTPGAGQEDTLNQSEHSSPRTPWWEQQRPTAGSPGCRRRNEYGQNHAQAQQSHCWKPETKRKWTRCGGASVWATPPR